MRAFVITGPRRAEVRDVAPPVAGPGQVVVDVERAGVCGTDTEFFTSDMAYLDTGQAAYPLRIGHEWCGTVSAVGAGVDPFWIGRRVTADTMLGCGRCLRCTSGRQHLCDDRYEIGIRGGWPGALAEQLPVPATALQPLPDLVDATLGALVEPGGNALRAVRGAALRPGGRLLVIGPGTIGLLVAQIARAEGAEVHVVGISDASLDFARSTGIANAWTWASLPALRYDAVIDASNAVTAPASALELVEPGGRVVYIGLAGEPSHGRHPHHRPQGRDGGRSPQRLRRAGRRGRAVRLGPGRPPSARGGHHRAGRGRRGAGRPPPRRLGCRAEGARRPVPVDPWMDHPPPRQARGAP